MRRVFPYLPWVACIALAGCAAYPRRSTSLTPAPADVATHAPDHVWRITFVEATVPPRRRGDLPWDPDGMPDPFVRVYRSGALLWEGPIAENTLQPTWNATIPDNVRLAPGEPLRIEVWDADEVDADPIGIWRGDGLPATAVPGADARIRFEGDATLMFRIAPPLAYRGLGIRRYEVRPDALVVLEIIENSPAGRAGLRPGDRIVAIDDQPVETLDERRAATELSLAHERGSRLTVERADGTRQTVEPDGTLVWLVR
ncbi:MAG: PDZ domain-containing protein [Myxococcales bacterium]|nr:PDZ domain-containing protein [Myxococcales bacterium]